MPLDIALRAAGASLLLLTATALMLGAPRSAIARSFMPFALGVAGFLGVNTAFDAAELPGAIWSISSFCSRMAAVFLWLFCLVLFDGRLRVPRTAVLVVVATWLALVVVDRGYMGPRPARLDISAVQIVLGIGLVLHASWRVLRDLRDDLVETRRRARPVFVFALLALLAMDFGVDVLQGYDWQPRSFLVLQNAAIVTLAAALALWLLRAAPWLEDDAAPAGVPPHAPGAAEPEAMVVARIETLMRTERPYLEPELTFAAFAARLGLPEAVTRRAINHRLGHGHFRTFLNGYRIEEARRRLRDPAHAGDKILAIALDSGFASLASFNRAFKQATGCAPSDYRATVVPEASVDASKDDSRVPRAR